MMPATEFSSISCLAVLSRETKTGVVLICHCRHWTAAVPSFWVRQRISQVGFWPEKAFPRFHNGEPDTRRYHSGFTRTHRGEWRSI